MYSMHIAQKPHITVAKLILWFDLFSTLQLNGITWKGLNKKRIFDEFSYFKYIP